MSTPPPSESQPSSHNDSCPNPPTSVPREPNQPSNQQPYPQPNQPQYQVPVRPSTPILGNVELQPLMATDFLKATFRTSRSNIVAILGLGGIVLIFMLIIQFVIFTMAPRTTVVDDPLNGAGDFTVEQSVSFPALLIFGIACAIGGMLGTYIISTAAVITVAHASGKTLPLSVAFSYVKSRSNELIKVAGVFAGIGFFFGLLFGQFLWNSGAKLLVLFLFLLIFAFVWARLAPMYLLITIDGADAKTAVLASFKMTAPFQWRYLGGTLLTALACTVPVSIIQSVIQSILAGLMFGLSFDGGSPRSFATIMILMLLISAISNSLISALFLPVWGLSYLDLALRQPFTVQYLTHRAESSQYPPSWGLFDHNYIRQMAQ